MCFYNYATSYKKNTSRIAFSDSYKNIIDRTAAGESVLDRNVVTRSNAKLALNWIRKHKIMYLLLQVAIQAHHFQSNL